MRRPGRRRLERVHIVVASSGEMRCGGTFYTARQTRGGRVIEENDLRKLRTPCSTVPFCPLVLQELRCALLW